MAEQTPDASRWLKPTVRDDESVPSEDRRQGNLAQPGIGQVDFTDETGTTKASVQMERVPHGYALRVRHSLDAYMSVSGLQEPPHLQRFDPEPDPDYCIEQSGRLLHQLTDIATEFYDHVAFSSEQEPGSDEPGDLRFLPTSGRDGSGFVIVERYADRLGWTDEKPAPVCWDWYDYGPARTPDGESVIRLRASGSTIPSDIDRLVDRARTWAAEHSEHAAGEQQMGRTLFGVRIHDHPGPTPLNTRAASDGAVWARTCACDHHTRGWKDPVSHGTPHHHCCARRKPS